MYIWLLFSLSPIIQDKIANGNLHGTMAEFILDSSFS